jgi:hypothetical protein
MRNEYNFAGRISKLHQIPPSQTFISEEISPKINEETSSTMTS